MQFDMYVNIYFLNVVYKNQIYYRIKTMVVHNFTHATYVSINAHEFSYLYKYIPPDLVCKNLIYYRTNNRVVHNFTHAIYVITFAYEFSHLYKYIPFECSL